MTELAANRSQVRAGHLELVRRSLGRYLCLHGMTIAVT